MECQATPAGTNFDQMIVAPQRVVFDVDAIMRMDQAQRINIAIQRLGAKTMTINEFRLSENEEPFKDPIYNEPGIPGGSGAVAVVPVPENPGKDA